MSSKVKLKRTKTKHYDFNKIKRVVTRDNLLAYSYFIEWFKICTNASYFQLGAAISQKVKPIVLYSKKLAND